MDFELTASMMCVDYGYLEREVKELEAGRHRLFPYRYHGRTLCPQFCHVTERHALYCQDNFEASGCSSYDRTSQQQYRPVPGETAQGRYCLYPSGGSITRLRLCRKSSMRR